MAKAIVINLTNTTLHLYTHAGESVSVLPSHGKSVTIDAKFMEWIAPHPNNLRVLYYLNDQGQRVTDLTPPPDTTDTTNVAVTTPHSQPTN
jgi:hypothetical protein